MATLRIDTPDGAADVWTETWAHSGRANRNFLLLHGNPGSLSDWRRVGPALAALGNVVAIDLPGFGRSPSPSNGAGGLSLEALAGVVIATANALDWREPIVIVGHSHGGGVAQIAAAKYPERIAGIVPTGTLGYPTPTSYRLLSLPGAAPAMTLAGALFRSRRGGLVTRALLWLAMNPIFAPESVPRDWIDREQALFAERPAILQSMVTLSLNRPSELLHRSAPSIRCPVLFLHGDEDRLCPSFRARTLHDRILASGGTSEFVLLPNAGHMLPEYQPREIVEHILAWEKRIRVRSISLEAV